MKPEDIRLMVATPAYGQITTDYNFSILNTMSVFRSKDIYMEVEFVEGSSLVMDARNQLVERFFASDCTHMIFIDSDISFEPEDVLTLIEHLDDEKQVICGLYPKKKPNWDMLSHMTKMGAPSNVLPSQTGTLDASMFSPIDPPQPTNVPVRVEVTGSGFILISKKVFEDVRQSYPEYTYYSKESGTYEEKFAWYDTRMVVNEDGYQEHVGEDVSFCLLCRGIGIDIWCCPWVNLGHTGILQFKSEVNYTKQS